MKIVLYFFIQDVHDESGVRYYLTKNLRKTEIGVMTIGAGASWVGILIPPLVEKFKLDFHCSKNCLNVTNFKFISCNEMTFFTHFELF